jgi:hypothetical protein
MRRKIKEGPERDGTTFVLDYSIPRAPPNCDTGLKRLDLKNEEVKKMANNISKTILNVQRYSLKSREVLKS